MNDLIFIKLIHMNDFNAILKVTKGQGLQVKGQGVNNAIMLKNCHGYKSQRGDRILIKIIHRIDIDI